MRNMFNKAGASALALSVVVGAGFLLTPTKSQAFVIYCTNCSTVFSQATQVAKEIETAVNTAQQLQTEISQYQNMLQQGLSLPNSVFSRLTNDIQQVQALYQRSTALAGNMANFDQQFRQQFKGYDTFLNNNNTDPSYLTNYYKDWSQQGLDSMRTAMEVSGQNVNQISQEDATLSQIMNRSASAQGRLQAIQAGNEIAAQQVQQMQKLRQMMDAQIQSQSMWYAQNVQRRAVNDASAATWSAPPVSKGNIEDY